MFSYFKTICRRTFVDEVPSESPCVKTTKMADGLDDSTVPKRRYSLGTDNEEEELQHKTRRATLSKTSLITQPEVPSVAVSISDLLSESDFNCDEVDSSLTSSAAAMLAFPTRGATAKYRKMYAFDSVVGEQNEEVGVSRRDKRRRSSTLSSDTFMHPSSSPTRDVVDPSSSPTRDVVDPSCSPTRDVVDRKSPHLEEVSTDVGSQLDEDVFDFNKIEENDHSNDLTGDTFTMSEVKIGESYLLSESEETQEICDNNEEIKSCKVRDLTETEKITDGNVEVFHTEDEVSIDVKTDEIKSIEGESLQKGCKLESDVSLQNVGVKSTSFEFDETNSVTKETHVIHQILGENNDAEVTSVNAIFFNGKLNNNETVTENKNVSDIDLSDISSSLRNESKNEVETEQSIPSSNFTNENINEIGVSKVRIERLEIRETECDDIVNVDNIIVENSSDTTIVTNVDEDAELNILPDKIISEDLGLASQTEFVYGKVDDRPIEDGNHEVMDENFYFNKSIAAVQSLSLLSDIDEESGPVPADKQIEPLAAESNNISVDADVNLILNSNTEDKIVTDNKGAGSCPAEVVEPEGEVVSTEETQQNNTSDNSRSLLELTLHEANCADEILLAKDVDDPEPSDQQPENLMNKTENMNLNSSTPRQEDLKQEAENKDTCNTRAEGNPDTSADNITKEPEVIESNSDTSADNIKKEPEAIEGNPDTSADNITNEPEVIESNPDTGADNITKEPEAIEGNPDTSADNITKELEAMEGNPDTSTDNITKEPEAIEGNPDTDANNITEEPEVNEDTQDTSAENITEETDVIGENEFNYEQRNNQEETEGNGYDNDNEEAARNELNNYITQQYSRASTPLDDPASVAEHAPVLAIPRTPTLINEVLESVS